MQRGKKVSTKKKMIFKYCEIHNCNYKSKKCPLCEAERDEVDLRC